MISRQGKRRGGGTRQSSVSDRIARQWGSFTALPIALLDCLVFFLFSIFKAQKGDSATKVQCKIIERVYYNYFFFLLLFSTTQSLSM